MASQQLAPILATNEDVPGSPFQSVPGGGQSESSAEKTGEEATKLKVLVVDDEQENLDYVRRCLHRRFEVDAVLSPSAALERLSRETYDIIITDQRMPELTGSKLLERSLEHSPQAVRIVITGYSDYEATVEAINLGKVTGFIQKPFAPTTLLGMLDSARSSEPRPSPTSRDDKFRSIVNQLPDAVAVEEAGRLVFANEAFGTLYRVSQPEELFGTPLSSLLKDETTPSSEEEYLATTSSGVAVGVRTSSLDNEARILRLRALSESRSKPVLIIVDEDARMLRSLRRLLSSQYHVHCVQSVDESLQIGRTAPRVDFVLCDERLPDGRPEDVMKGLSRIGHEVRPVVMTGSFSPEEKSEYPRLMKPFTSAELNTALDEARNVHG